MAAIKTDVITQSAGIEVSSEDIIARVKALWQEQGNKVKDITKIDVYLKPEEKKAYYVINGDKTGEIAV